MSISTIFTNVAKQAKSNSPELLAALGVSGVFTTSYLAVKAAIQVERDEDADPNATTKEKIKRYWKVYIPPAVSGVATIACIIGSNQASGRRTAAAVTAFSVTERAFAEYKDRVVEQLGTGSEQKLRDKLVQDKVNQNPPTNEVVFIGNGRVLHCELHTMRYFRCDRETLMKAQNAVNERVHSDTYVTMSEFYDMIGLEHTSPSDYSGWTEGRPLELRFTAVMSPGPEPEPCIGIEYNYYEVID